MKSLVVRVYTDSICIHVFIRASRTSNTHGVYYTS